MIFKELIKRFIPKFLLNFYHYILAFIGAVVYGFPGKNKKVKIIGVTGTSGKTTVVDLVSRVLGEAGYKTAYLSSAKTKIDQDEKENEFKMTMPGRMRIQQFLRRAISKECQFIILEVTSEGIRQSRHRFIDFDCAVFTNLTPEHIESHGGFENYRNEKLKLFKATKNIHIINTDDENSKYFLDIPANKKITFGIKDAQNIKFHLNLLGEFNVLNALTAICVGRAYGIGLETSKKALEKAEGIPGRMEIVVKSPFMAIVDLAHTPEQLEKAYKTISGLKSAKSSSLICVLGSSGGGRDKWKRPVLGKTASQFCDKVIITNEDPYDENPMDIINQIMSGTEGAQIIEDRKEAIKKALEIAKPGDIVVITGKGTEPYMCFENGRKIHWDDRKVTKELFDSMGY